ncbi:MAG: hypothetical protein HND52_17345 [Ignavibacteriae bacterium]|nr:hypothetical protein [Ignavibacteriota bacterium]
MNRTHIIILLLLLSSIAYPKANSDTPSFHLLTVKDGLTHNSGLCILQDKKGFLWIGTQNGLCRYDGYSIKKYINIPEDSSSISGNYINSIYEDSRSVIWIGTNQGGINKYDPITDTFKSYRADANDTSSIGEGSIYSINEDRFNNLWIAVNPSGLYLFDRVSEKFHHIQTDPNSITGLKGDRAYCLYKDSDSILWAGTSGGINKLSITERRNVANQNDNLLSKYDIKFQNWNSDKHNKNSLVNNIIAGIYEEKTNDRKTMWIGTQYGLSRMTILPEGTASFKNYNILSEYPKAIGSNLIWAITEDSNGNLLVGTKSEGLFKYDRVNDNFTKYYDPLLEPMNNNYTVRCFYNDKSGNLWIGTEDIGVLKLYSKRRNFSAYINNPKNPNSLSDNNVTAIFEDSKKNLWVGTKYGGLNKLSFKNRQLGYFERFTADQDDENSILHNTIKAICEDDKGNIWIGSWNIAGGLSKYIPADNKFIHYQNIPDDPNSLGENQVRSLSTDEFGNLWIGFSEAGMDKFDIANNLFTHYLPNPNTANSLSNKTITTVYSDQQGSVWISTFSGGFNKFDIKSESFKQFQFNKKNKFSISSNRVWTSFKDSFERLWVGTDNGLDYFERGNERFIHFNKSNGLMNNAVYGIIEDNSRKIWLSLKNGLCKIEFEDELNIKPKNARFINFDANDHSSITEFYNGSCLKSFTGELFFGGVNGLLYFDPDEIELSDHAPNVAITSLKIFEAEAELDTQIVYKKNIDLPSSNNFFSIEFAALDYMSPEKNQYAYKLEGLHSNWVYCCSRRFVSFNHLDPGSYKFKVKASNGDGVWNEAGTSLLINIIPPFWLTTWFRILSSIIFITLGVLLLRSLFTKKYKQRLRELATKQKIQNERERISRELHDSIGSNLTSIITGLEISKKYFDKGDRLNLSENISSLECHTRNTIEELRQTIWSLHEDVKNFGDLNEKIRELLLHKIKLGDNLNVKYKFKGDESFSISSVDALNIFRIFQEAVNNAVKYSECSEIKLSGKLENNSFILKISDNGKGFDVQAAASCVDKFGLKNMEQRADQIDAVLKIESEIGLGTIITVTKSF